MTNSEFALKYPETVVKVQSMPFPCIIEDTIFKDAKSYVSYLIKNNKEILIDIKAVDDALNLYQIDNKMFEDYKDIKKDLYVLLGTKMKEKDKNFKKYVRK